MSATLAAFSAFLSIFSSFFSPVANKKPPFAQQAREAVIASCSPALDIEPVGPAPAVFGYSVVEREYIRRRCEVLAAPREPVRAPRGRPRRTRTSYRRPWRTG